MTCGRAQGFLARTKVDVATQVDARKTRLGPAPALALLDGVRELWVAKGKKVVQVDLEKARPDRQTLLGLLMGPTGNLRAPTVRVGRRLMVGFDEALYRKLVG
jgi:arsenate reductase-like glutaredoxin family protein